MRNSDYSQRSQSMYSQGSRGSRQRRRNNQLQQQGLQIAGQNMTCIPLSEINRMKNMIKDDKDPVVERFINDKNRTMKLNAMRTKNWNDTTQAKKRIKAKVKFTQFKEKELIKRKIDSDERAFQDKNKAIVIGKANKQIFAQSDKVKGFHSRLMIADCLKEREFQISINRRKEDLNKMLAKQHLDILAEEMRRLDREEKERRKKIYEKKLRNQKVLHEQHEAMKMKYIKRMQEERIEGEVIKRHAQEAIEKENEEQEKRRQKRLQLVRETKQANDNLQHLKQLQKEKEAEEERQMEIYAKKKQARVDMRKAREEERFREKQAARQRLIDRQVKRLEQMKDEENLRIDNQIKEAEIKKVKEMAKRKAKRNELKDEMDNFTQIYWDKKNRDTKKQKQEDKYIQEFWVAYNRKLGEQELQEKANRRQRAKDLQQYHFMQARQKQLKTEKELKQELKQARKMKFATEQEDKQYNKWAEECLDEWRAQGKNVTPLVLELTAQKNAHKGLKFI